jgi:hypothetical protein
MALTPGRAWNHVVLLALTYAAGFDALVKRWDKCINVGAGINVFPRFEYHVIYVLYPFLTYLLSLPRNKEIVSVHARMFHLRNAEQIYMKFSTRCRHEMLRECNFNPFRLNTKPHFDEAQRLDFKKRLLVRNAVLVRKRNIDIIIQHVFEPFCIQACAYVTKKRLLGRSKHSWEDNIKIELRTVDGCRLDSCGSA